MAWEYQQTLNVGLTVLLVVGVGWVSVCARVFDQKDVRVLNNYVFKIGLPCQILLGLGVQTNLYDSQMWRFVAAFLLLRAFVLAGALAFTGVIQRGTLGDCMTHWLAGSWISTVIIGGPVLQAVLGPNMAKLGVWAGLSSFLFQLPLMLIGFEIDRWHRDNKAAAAELQMHTLHADGSLSSPNEVQLAPGTGPLAADPATQHNNEFTSEDMSTDIEAGKKGEDGAPHDGVLLPVSMPSPTPVQRQEHHIHLPFGYGVTVTQLRALGSRLLHNHVLWAVFFGLLLAFSTLGYKYLAPGTCPKYNPRFVVATGFISMTLDWCGRCTEPLALLATGIWLAAHLRLTLDLKLIMKGCAYMFVKLLLVPLLAVACAEIMGLNHTYARAAVVLATLPVSLAAYALAKEYNINEDAMVMNVVLGILLMLPTVIVWLEVMDAINLFPVP